MKGIRVVIEVDPTENWASPGETLDGLCESVCALVRMNGSACGAVVVKVDCGGLGRAAMQHMQNMHGIMCEPLEKPLPRARW